MGVTEIPNSKVADLQEFMKISDKNTFTVFNLYRTFGNVAIQKKKLNWLAHPHLVAKYNKIMGGRYLIEIWLSQTRSKVKKKVSINFIQGENEQIM